MRNLWHSQTIRMLNGFHWGEKISNDSGKWHFDKELVTVLHGDSVLFAPIDFTSQTKLITFRTEKCLNLYQGDFRVLFPHKLKYIQ